jgi:hypothetical protein
VRLHTSAPVLGPTARRPVVAVVALAAGTVALLAVRYWGVAGPGSVESVWATYLRQALAHHREILLAVVPIGHPSSVLAGAVLLSGAGLALRRPRLAAVALVAPLLTGAVTDVLQSLIGRTLNGGFAMPSGHTAGATSIAIVVALVGVGLAGRCRRPVAIFGGIAVLLVAATMAVALVVNQLHYVTDTVAGFCTAVALVLGVALVVDRDTAWTRPHGRATPRRVR